MGQTYNEKPSRGKIWWSSIATLVGASMVDAHSSWGRQELNPILQNSNGGFGAKGIAIKAIITGSVVTAQWLLLKNNRPAEKYAAIANFGMASMLGGVAIHNYGNGSVGINPPSEQPRPEYLTADTRK